MITDLFYFSGTGNSLFIAKTLKEQLEIQDNESVNIYPMVSKGSYHQAKSEADRIGLIYPTYDLDAPAIVKNFTRAMTIGGNPYVFLYGNSGGYPGVSLDSIKNIISEKGIQVAAAFHTTYPDNSHIKQIDKDKATQTIVKARESHIKDSSTIYKKIATPNHPLLNVTKVNYIMAKGANLLFQNIVGLKDIRVNTSKCNGCNLCTHVCPMENITLSNKKPTFQNNCEMCLACVNLCPQNALRYRHMAKRKNNQYKHPEITIKELILE